MRLRKSELMQAMKGVIFLLLSCGLVTTTYVIAWSQGKETAAIIENAKKEGRVVWYTTMSLGSSDVVRKKFEEKYPPIKVEIIRLSDEKLLNRIVNETRGKAFLVDAIQAQALTMELLKKEGLLGKYISPESKYYAEGSKDPEGYWTSIYMNAKGIGYNTNMVSSKDAPKQWEDLLDPKWKGKLLMDTGDFEWYGNVLKIWGRQKGLDYMKKLSEQKPHFRTGHTLEAMLVAAGEYPVAVVLNVDRVEELKSQGAPVRFVGADPAIARIHPIGLAKNSSRPNATKLFIDYTLSTEGQNILSETKRIPARQGVESFVSTALRGVKLHYADVGLESQYEQIMKEYKEIFMK